MIRSAACALAFTFVIASPGIGAGGQQTGDDTGQQIVRKEFVIVRSTGSYEEARLAAAAAARQLHVPLRLRNLAPDGNGGLTFPAKECEDNGWSAPCYVPRGRWDDGFYVSIEHSSGYPEFKPNLFIVVVASASRGSAVTKRARRVARTAFPDAYLRSASVYMGCMH